MKLVVLKISKVVLLTATVIVLLFYGIFAGEHHWFPFRQYTITKNTIKTLINKTENLNPTHLPYSDTIKGIWHKVGAYKGDFLVSLINNDNQQEIRLYGANNQLKKQLILDFENIANQFEPNSAQGIKPLKKFSAMFSHGLKMTSSGDLILNIEQLGICKIDFSGKVKWAYQYYTHHSVDIDNNNNIWVCGSQLTNISLTDTITDQSILQLNSNGKVIKSVSIHKILEKNGLSGLLYSNGVSIRHDRFHLNDIEAFKGNERVFNHNHLLISLRNINTVLLYNHINQKVDKVISGYFYQQHDPDFKNDSTISVFDNKYYNDQQYFSRIISFDKTFNFKQEYGGTLDHFFYTDRLGGHQWLPNGNLLITSSREGKVFEVTPSGKTVWIFTNTSDAKAAVIFDAYKL